MRLKLAVPVLGALALIAALPDAARAGGRSSVDVSVGLGYSNYGGHHGGHGRSYYNTGVAFRYSRGYGHSSRYHDDTPRRSYRYGRSRSGRSRYYAPRPVYRDSYYSDTYYAPRRNRHYGHGYGYDVSAGHGYGVSAGYGYGYGYGYRPLHRGYYGHYGYGGHIGLRFGGHHGGYYGGGHHGGGHHGGGHHGGGHHGGGHHGGH